MTFGAGGHTLGLLEACPDIKVIGLDRDPLANKYVTPIQHRYGRYVSLCSRVYGMVNFLILL